MVEFLIKLGLIASIRGESLDHLIVFGDRRRSGA